jgi:hypothetical protein
MEKLSDKEWLALRRYSTAPLSEIWRDAIDIVLTHRPVSYTVEEVCAAYNKPKPKPKTEETAASWNEEQIRKSICSAWQPWWSADIDGPNFADHVYAALKGQKPKTTEERVHEILVGCGCTTEKFNEIMALIGELKRKGSAENL